MCKYSTDGWSAVSVLIIWIDSNIFTFASYMCRPPSTASAPYGLVYRFIRPVSKVTVDTYVVPIPAISVHHIGIVDGDLGTVNDWNANKQNKQPLYPGAPLFILPVYTRNSL